MRKKNNEPKKPQEKVITGSGADVVSHEDEQGRVKCKCIVPCVWRGYRDEGDTVWIEKELIKKDDFIKMHFKAVDGVVVDAGQDGHDEDEGHGGGQERCEDAASTDEGGERGEGGTAADEGQGELDLK